MRLLLEGPAHGYDLRRKLAAYRAFYPLYTVLDDRDAALDAGANAYVCKTREDAGRQLVDCVDELLGKVAANPDS